MTRRVWLAIALPLLVTANMQRWRPRAQRSLWPSGGSRSVTAPASGRVTDVLARAGETVAAGPPVVSLLLPGNIFARFFVPEAAFSTVHLSDPVALACDGCPADLPATISFISPQAE